MHKIQSYLSFISTTDKFDLEDTFHMIYYIHNNSCNIYFF